MKALITSLGAALMFCVLVADAEEGTVTPQPSEYYTTQPKEVAVDDYGLVDLYCAWTLASLGFHELGKEFYARFKSNYSQEIFEAEWNKFSGIMVKVLGAADETQRAAMKRMFIGACKQWSIENQGKVSA
jgi:hypothetical protein